MAVTRANPKPSIKVTHEGDVKRLEIYIDGLDSATFVNEVSTCMSMPDWQPDLIGVTMRSWSAKDPESICSIVFIIMEAFGSVVTKVKTLEDLMRDCVNYLNTQKFKPVAVNHKPSTPVKVAPKPVVKSVRRK